MRFLLLFSFLLIQSYTFGQIQFSIEQQSDGRIYFVKLKPDESYNGPKNLTNSAQISLVVPTGGFQVGNIQNEKGNWQNNNNIIAPASNPKKDYLIFNLLGHIKDVIYEEGEEVILFSFENVGKKTGKPRFVTKKDIGLFKSKKLNIGNQISVLGAGFKNAFSGVYDDGEETEEIEESHVLYGDLIPTIFDLVLNVKKEGFALDWLANQAKDIKKMTIEKSLDGEIFQTIEAISDNDDSQQFYIDNAPDFGDNHYRVRIDYANGEYQYSNVQQETYKLDAASINIYPNPVSDYLNLRIGHYAEVEGQVRIFNMAGLEMANQSIQKDQKQLRINTSQYVNGLYFLIIEAKNQKILERQFIVEQGK